MKGSICFLNSHVEDLVNFSVPSDGCTQIDEVTDLVDGLTLNLQLSWIAFVERTLGIGMHICSQLCTEYFWHWSSGQRRFLKAISRVVQNGHIVSIISVHYHLLINFGLLLQNCFPADCLISQQWELQSSDKNWSQEVLVCHLKPIPELTLKQLVSSLLTLTALTVPLKKAWKILINLSGNP